MRKKFIANYIFRSIWVILLISTSIIYSSGQDPVFTQFYNTPIQINPAFAGNSAGPTFIANYRNQWPAFNAYDTYSVSYEQKLENLNSGIGLYILSDDAGGGSIKSNRAHGMFSYHLRMDNGSTLRLGLEAGIIQSRLDWSKLIFFDQLDPQFGAVGPGGVRFPSDEIPPDGDFVNNIYLDISAGMLYSTEKYFAGISFSHMNQPEYSFLTKTENVSGARIPMRIALMGGYQHTLLNANNAHYGTYITPSILLMRQGNFNQINGQVIFNFNQLILGTGYRHAGVMGDAVIAYMGWRYEYMKFGYSFDFTVSGLGIGSGGSHEISIMVNLDHLYAKPSRYNDCFGIFR